VTIFDYGRTLDGVFYYAMELLEGASLEAVVAEGGPLPPARVIKILHDVASALVEAHEAGLIHRDIKPANIILCRQGGTHDFPKVVDFGLVKELEGGGAVALTQTDTITGTPLYMPPRPSRHPRWSAPSGPLLPRRGRLLRPHRGARLQRREPGRDLLHHIHTTPVRPSARSQRPIPADLEALILACLEKDPADRPASAEELRRGLAACGDFGRWTPEDALAWWTEHPCLLGDPAARGDAEPTTLQRVGVPSP